MKRKNYRLHTHMGTWDEYAVISATCDQHAISKTIIKLSATLQRKINANDEGTLNIKLQRPTRTKKDTTEYRHTIFAYEIELHPQTKLEGETWNEHDVY